MERELVKIVCDNSIGYYTQFKDLMKPGDVIYSPVLPKETVKKPIKKQRKVKK